MKDKKREVIGEILHRLAAKFVLEEGSKSSLLTITRVETSPTGKEAKIFFTTLPEDQQDTALKFLERKAGDFKMYVRDNSRIGIVPHLAFKIDFGERNRQRLDTLS
ncbi:MAG: ribosome-binding factor A [Candidatus Zambryskibacteria bacterium]|nr:ribosome-binding factor A [Candidatus Zambryskibacteria bacterium]